MIFFVVDRLEQIYKPQVVASPNLAGKPPRQAKQPAATVLQRRVIFKRRVRSTPTSVCLDSGAILFVSSSSSKPYNYFPNLTLLRSLPGHKTVAAAVKVLPDFVAIFGDVGGTQWSR